MRMDSRQDALWLTIGRKLSYNSACSEPLRDNPKDDR